MDLNDRFYKSTEVSEILGVSLRTLYRYMDSGKIQSVQLPSGRHRFTKQQLENFLYSNGSGGLGQGIQNQSFNQNDNRPYVDTGYSQNRQQNFQPNQGFNNQYSQAQNPYGNQQAQNPSQGHGQQAYSANPYATPVVNNSPFQSPSSQPVADKPVINEEVEDLDAELEELLASLEDDEPSEETTSSNFSQPDVVSETPVQKSSPFNSQLGGLGDFDLTEKDEVALVDENVVKYFYCPYNQLRAIARLVKTTSEDNGKKYAFTMNAGLSLYFPLDPFSVIHFYIEENDLEFWKDSLQLKESIKTDANIGILLTKGDALEGAKEVSGLKVVSKEIMIKNLKANGLDSLISQVESKL